MPRSVSGRKMCSCPRDCSVRAAHRRNSKTCPDALSSSVVQGWVMGPDSRFVHKIKSLARDFPTQGSEEGKEVLLNRYSRRAPAAPDDSQLLPRAAMLGLWTSIKAPPN